MRSRSHRGSVTFVQRFGSDLRLNVPFHALVLDGACAETEEGELVFHPTPAPNEDDLARIARRVPSRVARELEAQICDGERRRGRGRLG